VREVHDFIASLTKPHFHSQNIRSQITIIMEHKKDTIVLDYTKSPSYLRRQHWISSPVSSSTMSTDRLAKATAAAHVARKEAALRVSRRYETSLASQGGGTAEKEGGEDEDGEKYREGHGEKYRH
jgi:hypothetical protein